MAYMQKIVVGKAFVLGDDVDTDQIIPAQYLAHNPNDPGERKYFGMYAMSGVPTSQSGLPQGGRRFVPEGQYRSDYPIVIGGKNFGCGSSREHAPLAMAEAGVQVVVAEFYARIFFRNCVNGGYLLPCECDHHLIDQIKTDDLCEVNLETGTLLNKTTGKTFPMKPLGDVKPVIEAGGIFGYARQTGMLRATKG
jgi:3-isopropylmalate/(R)-2-methylmalate dehydratase small subunit